MADDDKPLAQLVKTETAMDAPKPEPAPAAEPAPEIPTADRLREFEDATLGQDAPRHDGEIEKGSGSPFSRMSDAQKAHHAALEALMEAEAEHTAAGVAMDAADKKLEAAVKRAAATEENI